MESSEIDMWNILISSTDVFIIADYRFNVSIFY